MRQSVKRVASRQLSDVDSISTRLALGTTGDDDGSYTHELDCQQAQLLGASGECTRRSCLDHMIYRE